ncbi:MAG: hypothetical protein JXR54_11025 [Tannerellaceae bacterium]|nr:hypothetical protein [Tannerellaceae bacterium]
MAFNSWQSVIDTLNDLGARKIIYKALVENDNSKQQIYLGGDFSVLSEIPFGAVVSCDECALPNLKAPVDFWWINNSGEYAPAPYSQLILYPKYPEVRLSGFMQKCKTAPTGHMNPVPKESRGPKNLPDGRFLFLGICEDKRIYAYLAIKDSAVSKSMIQNAPESLSAGGKLQRIIDNTTPEASKISLIRELQKIISYGWHNSCRMDKDGKIIPYSASNAGGYTLEALLGIIPNGIAAPDFFDWELKAFTKTRLTLMTPEPNLGLYHEKGATEFTIRYGHQKEGYLSYFTGTHKCNIINNTTGLKMILSGFDYETGKITKTSGGILLLDKNDRTAAGWSYSSLIEHWARKHSNVCYIKYESKQIDSNIQYRYLSPLWFGTGTDFSLFLKAMHQHKIIFDPGTNVKESLNGKTKVKARSQFRINFKDIGSLYNSFQEHQLISPN